MKSYLISDNRDTHVGMRLAGISGVIVHERDEIIKELNESLEDNEIGLIILTEKIYEKIKYRVIEIKTKKKYPLIVVIPDRHGFKREGDFITKYIKESVGLKI